MLDELHKRSSPIIDRGTFYQSACFFARGRFNYGRFRVAGNGNEFLGQFAYYPDSLVRECGGGHWLFVSVRRLIACIQRVLSHCLVG